MKKKAFSLLNDKKVYTTEFLEVLSDRSLINRFHTLKGYLDFHHLVVNPKDVMLIRKRLEKELKEQVFQACLAIYACMTQTEEWGMAGEQQVKLSYSRHLLDIKPDEPFAFEHFTQFEEKVQALIKEHEYHTYSKEKLQKIFNTKSFQFFGQKYKKNQIEEINALLAFIGIKERYFAGFYTHYPMYMVYTGREEFVEKQHVIWIDKEWVRTPNIILSLAAMNGKREVYLRLDSLRVIFDQKWCQIFRYNTFDYAQISYSQERQFSEGIKEKVLSLYDVHSEQDLKEIRAQFIADMGETIKYHEIGHVIVQHDMMPIEVGALTEATKPYPDNIYMTILEILADFAPRLGKLRGAIANIVEVSKTDVKRAERMFYMYVSDTWFYDTEDTYMYAYSDIIMLLLLRYIKSNTTLDFERLEKDMLFKSEEFDPLKKPEGLIEILMKVLTMSIFAVKKVIENAHFEVKTERLKYKEIAEVIHEFISERHPKLELRSYEYYCTFWTHMIHQLKTYSPQEKELVRFIDKEKSAIMKKLFQLTQGKEAAEKYNYDVRQFIFENFKALKIVTKGHDIV